MLDVPSSSSHPWLYITGFFLLLLLFLLGLPFILHQPHATTSSLYRNVSLLLDSGHGDDKLPLPLPSPTPIVSSTPLPLKIALCVVGSLRTFLLPPVYTSIHDHLVLPHPPGTVDVYLFLTTHHTGRSNEDGQIDQECSAVPLSTAQELLHPVHTSLNPFPSDCQHLSFKGQCCGERGSLTESSYIQLGAIDACFTLAASKGGGTYSHFMRTRPDLYIGSPVPSWVWAAKHSARTVWTMDKDAPGSDMLFLFGVRLLEVWWRSLPWSPCTAFPVGSPEYFIFEGMQQASPQFQGKLYFTGYNRSVGRKEAPYEEDEEPVGEEEEEGGGVGMGNGTTTPAFKVIQLRSMRNIIVRSTSTVACWRVGFFCPTRDEVRLKEELGKFTCSEFHRPQLPLL